MESVVDIAVVAVVDVVPSLAGIGSRSLHNRWAAMACIVAGYNAGSVAVGSAVFAHHQVCMVVADRRTAGMVVGSEVLAVLTTVVARKKVVSDLTAAVLVAAENAVALTVVEVNYLMMASSRQRQSTPVLPCSPSSSSSQCVLVCAIEVCDFE